MPTPFPRPPRQAPRARLLLVALGATVTLSGCSWLRIDKAAQVATGSTAQWLCGAAFIGGDDPAATFEQQVLKLPGMGLVGWGLRYQVDPLQRSVSATVAGGFERRSVYRGPLGCMAEPVAGDPVLPALPTPESLAPATAAGPVMQPPIVDPAAPPVAPHTPALAAAIDQAFGAGETDPHHTRALVVLQRGRIVGERYAHGAGPDTPLLGFSMNKSLANALAGALVQQGHLAMQAPAALPAWRAAADDHRLITPEHLLRQTSGLDLLQDNSGFDASAQIMFTVRDKVAAAAAAPLQAPPGRHWQYTDPHFILLGRLLRDAAGGGPGELLNFARTHLFGPLGMRSVTMEFDATGTPVSAATTYASARDWARLGQLYLDDGMAGGRRLLPEGWVRWTTTPTAPASGPIGYGAGFWLNSVAGEVPHWGIPWGLPKAPTDTFFARGFLGQFVVVVPSRQVVIVRLGTSQVYTRDNNIAVAMDRWVAAILAALPPGP